VGKRSRRDRSAGESGESERVAIGIGTSAFRDLGQVFIYYDERLRSDVVKWVPPPRLVEEVGVEGAMRMFAEEVLPRVVDALSRASKVGDASEEIRRLFGDLAEELGKKLGRRTKA
jgi:hypothetical protein